MKKQLTLTLTIALTLALIVMASMARSAGGAPQKPKSDSGVVTLGPNQAMRVIISAKFQAANVRIRNFGYSVTGMVGGIKNLGVSGQAQSDLIAIAPGEAVSFDVPGVGAMVRAMVTTNNPDIQVTNAIVDTVTGDVESFIGGEGGDGTGI
ncbi:MAG: hypothetical protein ABL962_08985 [Fimbriimonadaceae bacterium]